jgi:hypothetical protein
MFRIVRTNDRPKLMELSLKQRQQIITYRQERQERYLSEEVTLRELLADPRTDLRLKNKR